MDGSNHREKPRLLGFAFFQKNKGGLDMDIAGISQVMTANYENNKVGKDVEKKNTENSTVEAKIERACLAR